MAENKTVTTATFRAEEQGVAETASALGRLQKEAAGAASATEKFTKETSESAKGISSFERSVETLQRKLAGAPAAWRDFEKSMSTANKALAAGRMGTEEYARSVQQIQQQLQRVVAPKLDLTVDATGLSSLLGTTEKISVATRQAATEMLRMAQAKQVADAEVARGQEMLSRETARYAAEIDSLRAAYDPAFAAAQRLNKEVDDLARLEREGIAIAGGYAAALDRIVDKYDDTGRAAREAAQAQADFIRQARDAQNEANAAMDARRMSDEGQSRYSAPAANGVAGRGANWLSRQDAGPSRSARESASVFEEEARAVAQLRAEINPLGTAYEKMTAQVATYEDMARRHVITSDELAMATSHARKAFDDTAKGLPDLNGKVKITSDQMRNLSYQGNDVATMWMSGSSWTQIAATQIGQVVQAMQDGPGGLRGSLNALKDSAIAGGAAMVSALGPIGFAFAGATVAAGAFALAIRKDVPDANTTLTKHQAILDEIGSRYDGLAEKVKAFGSNASEALNVRAGSNVRDLARVLDTQRKELERSFVGGSGLFGMSAFGQDETKNIPALPQFDPIRKEVEAFRESLRAGNPDIEAFRTKIYAAYDALDEGDPMRKAYEKAITLTEEFYRTSQSFTEAERAARMLSPAMQRIALDAGQAAERAQKANATFRSLVPGDMRPQVVQITEAFEKLRETTYGPLNPKDIDQFKGALADLSRDAVQQARDAQNQLANLSLSPDARTIAEIQQRYDAEIAELERVNGAEETLAAKRRERDAALGVATAEITRADNERRASLDLDLQAVTARTAAEKAQIAAERERISYLAQGYTEAEAGARAEEARRLSLAQASEQYTEALRQQTLGTQRQIEQAQLEYDLIGKSAGEVARLRTEFELLAQAKDAATAAGYDAASVTVTDAMREQAAEIGRLTDATQRLNLERDQSEQMRMLEAEAGLMHLNADAREIVLAGLQAESELRRDGIDANSAWGQSYVENARQIARMEGALDKQAEAFETLGDAAQDFFDALGSGESVLDALVGAFGSLGKQLTSGGFEKLFGGLFGGAGQGASTVAQIASTLGRANVPAVAATISPAYPYADKYALPTPTPAIRQTSDRLAQTVTQSVSTNLLKSMLGAGKSESHITGLNTRFASALTDMLQAAPAAVQSAITINSGFRSVARQAELFDAALKKYGSVAAARKWVAPPGNSQHNRGMAADLGYGNTAARQWVHQNAGDYGLTFPMSHENWHIELKNGRTGRTGAVVDERTLSRGVSDGMQNYSRRTNYSAPVGDRWGGMREGDVVGTAAPSRGFGFGQTAMGAIGAGLSIFSQGYQSGNPLMGGLSGAMGGFQAGSALFPALGMAGPIGAGIGALVGIAGGILGKRAERKKAHQEAAAKWEQMRPQYEAFDQSLSGDTKGGLRTWITDQWNQLSSYMSVGGAAWKNGTGNSTAQFRSTGSKLFERFHEMLREFQGGYVSMIHDMESGEGLQGAFAKGRNATKDLKAQIQATRDDIDIAFGNVADIGFLNTPDAVAQAKASEEARAIAIERYNKAAGEYALSLMYTSVQVSDVRKTIDGFRGTAAGLHDVFADLGWSAEDAAAAIEGRLNQAIANVAKGLNEGIRDRIEELAGVGYFSSVRTFLAEFDTLKADVAAAGADPSQLNDLFGRELQAIVDGAELTGTAFTDLVAMFPQLSGVVREFANSIERTAEQLADAIQGYDDRAFAAVNDNTTLAGALAEFERKAAADRKAEALAGNGAIVDLERALAAERAKIEGDFARTAREAMQTLASNRYEAAVNARAEAESALRAEYERTVDYVDGIRGYLSDMRLDDNLSTLSGREQFNEAQKLFRETLFKANGGDQDAQDKLLGVTQDYQNEAKAYYATSAKYGEVYAEIEATLKATATRAETELDVAKRQAGSLLDLVASTKGMADLLKEYFAAQAAVNKAASGIDASRDWGIRPVANRKNVAEFRAAGLPEYMGNFGPGAARAGELNSWLSTLTPSQYARAMAIMTANNAIQYASGGLVTGPGTGTSDSIPARLSNGEFVMTAAAVQRIGVPNLEAMRLTRQMPIAMPNVGRVEIQGNGNRGIEERLDRLEALMRTQITTTGGGLARVAQTGDRTALAAEQSALADRRNANNKQAA